MASALRYLCGFLLLAVAGLLAGSCGPGLEEGPLERIRSFRTTRQLGQFDLYRGAWQMDLVIDPQGDIWATWLEASATRGEQLITRNPEAIVIARYDKASSSWKEVHRALGESSGSQLEYAKLLWASNRNGYLIWTERAAQQETIKATRYNSRQWEEPRTVASSSTTPRTDLQAVLDRDHNPHLSWLADNVIQGTSYHASADAWSKVAPLLSANNPQDQIISLVGRQFSTAHHLFFVTNTLGTLLLWEASWSEGSPINSKMVAELPSSVAHLQLGTSQQEAAFLLWHNSDSNTLLITQRESSAGSWSSPRQLASATGARAIVEPRLSVVSNGNAMVSWIERENDLSEVRYASYLQSQKQWPDSALFQSIGASEIHVSSLLGDAQPCIAWAATDSAPARVQFSGFDAASSLWPPPLELGEHKSGEVIFPRGNMVVDASGQLGLFWAIQREITQSVGGVILSYDQLELWAAIYH